MKSSPKKQTKKKWQLKDLKEDDWSMLGKAYSQRPDQLLCLGVSYYPLKGLGFVESDGTITPEGRNFLRDRYAC